MLDECAHRTRTFDKSIQSLCAMFSRVGLLWLVLRAKIDCEMMKKSEWTESIRNYEMRYHQYTNAAYPFGLGNTSIQSVHV